MVKAPLLRRFAAAGALLIFFALALHFAVVKAPTADEGVHVARGWALWQPADLRLQAQPPLSHWLNGLFLRTEPTLPDLTTLTTWPTGDRPQIAHELLWESGVDVERVIFLARVPIIFLALVMGAVLGRWARAWTGRDDAPLLALFLFALSPNVLAAAGLATTDLATAALFLITIFALWRYLQRPGRWRWLLVAIALGLGLGTKLTAAILLPVTFVLVIVHGRGANEMATTKKGVLLWLSWLPVAALVLWALYRFELRPLPGLRFPVPAATYVDGYLHVEGHLESGHPAFLLGETSREGWWYYFVVAFLLKTPVPVLVLLGPAAVLAARRWRKTIFLWLPAGALFTAASVSGLNIGYRHIVPALPFLWMLIAVSAPWGWPGEGRGRRLRPLLLLFLGGWVVFGAVRQHPHYLAYFNEMTGGPDDGYKYLGDSNIDWGQDLTLLADLMAESDDAPVRYSYFGASDPAYYGIKDSPLHTEDGGRAADFAPANPAAGRYAISVNHVQGMVLNEPDLFEWFRRREPVGSVGYSILLYEVPAADGGTWIAQCVDPAPLLEPEMAADMVGAEEGALRHVLFNCNEGWVFPGAGRPGWYILPQRAAPWPMAERFPPQLRHVYAHSASQAAPSYDVYYWAGNGEVAETLAGGPGTVTLPDGTPVDLPVEVMGEMGRTAMLIGYWRETGGDGERWATVWRAANEDVQGLTIAAHLYGDGPTPTVADGLGFTATQWEPGDVFAQYHSFPVSVTGEYLATGLYEFTSGERLPFRPSPGTSDVETEELYLFPGEGEQAKGDDSQ